MAQYSPLGITDVANLALLEIGQQPIDDIDDTNGEAPAACRAAFWQCVRSVGRAHNWNCLKKRQNLVQLTFPQNSSVYSADWDFTAIGWPGPYPSTPPPYWLANTLYTGGTLVTYGEIAYYCLQAHTSSSNFINDMSGGLWSQLFDPFNGNANSGPASFLYEWNFGYALPQDFLLLNELNGVDCTKGRGIGSLYELFINQITNSDGTISNAQALFTDECYADVKYTALIQDPTVWDPQFIDCVSVFLASRISTQIRGDDGKMSLALLQKYKTVTLPEAMLKDSGEIKDRRYDPTKESNFLRSRQNSTNG